MNTECSVISDQSSDRLLREVGDLRRRVAALEECVSRKHALRKATQNILEGWPGPFTIRQIEATLRETRPELMAQAKVYAVPGLFSRWEKQGILSRSLNGRGRLGSIFVLSGKFPNGTRPGAAYGRTAKYESGFRSIVRRALADMPERFTLDDVRAWMARTMPAVEIPYGSWSSTLYKLQQQGELVCVENRSKTASVNRKVYARGPKRVAPTGDELAEIETAWRQFRESMGIQAPELEMSAAGRAEE